MKKIKIISLLFLSLFILVGCNKKYYLNEKYYSEAKIIDINAEELKKLEDNKESFGILLYTNGCTSCAQFKIVLNEFIKNNNITFYSISTEYFDDTSINEYVKYSPAFLLYKNGKVKAYIDPNKDKDTIYFKTNNDFTKWIEKSIYLEKK